MRKLFILVFSHSIYRANKALVTLYFEKEKRKRFDAFVKRMKSAETNRELLKPSNKVMVRGTIIGTRSSATLTSYLIITDGGEEKGSTVVNVIFYGQLKEAFKVKDHVDIIAHMQSRIKKTEDGKSSFHQIVVGDKIKKTNRLLADYIPFKEFQTPEGGIPDDMNKAFIYGKVSRVYVPGDGFAIITVMVPSKEAKKNYVDVICYKRQAQIASLLAEGDCVVSIGELRSAKEKPKGDEVFWQSVICKDISKVREEDMDLSVYI